MLPLVMMLPKPCLRIWGLTCFMPSITLRTSVAIAASKRSTSRPSRPPVCARRLAAGIVEQAIDAAKFVDRGADQRLHLVFLRDVGLPKQAIRPEPFGK